MTDCLIIGFNDTTFGDYVGMLRSMGTASGAYRDVELAFVEADGRAMRCLDMLNAVRVGEEPFHNADFLWPVVLYLHTYLTRRGFASDYVNLFHLERERLRAKLLAGDVRTVAITTTLYVSPEPILEIVRFVRAVAPSVAIIVGGPYVRNQMETAGSEGAGRVMDYLGADYYVVSQEGEATLAALLGALAAGGPLGGIANLGYRRDGRFVLDALVTEANRLEHNMVDYGLFPAETLGRFVSIRTAKSCPFRCAFCGFPKRAGEYQYLPLELVARELDALAERGVTLLTILDDTFNVPKKRYKDILRLMIERRYGFRWNSFYRCDHGDDEAIDLMAEAGCEGVFIGAESGSDAMLERMNKTVRRHNFLHSIPRLQSLGISCHANLVVGFPGETRASVDETIDLIERARPDYFRAQLWYADPMTPIWERREEFGIKGEAFTWSHRTMDSDTACDEVERMFLCVNGSDWLPQHGFEQWSTFYLQRRGMTPTAIKDLVRSFNAAVKSKLLSPDRRRSDPAVMAELRAAAAAGRQGEEPRPAVRALAGDAYLAAERHWVGQFESRADLPAAFSGLVTAEKGAPRWQRFDSCRGGALVGDLCRSLAATPEAVAAAALAAAAARLSGEGDVALLAGGQPLRLQAGESGDFAGLVAQADRRLVAGASHARFAPPLMGNAIRLGRHGLHRPRFGAAVLAGTDDAAAPALAAWTELAADLCLLLAIAPSGAARFHFDERRLEPDLAAALERIWTEILTEAATDPWAGSAPVPRPAEQDPQFAF